MGNRLISTMRGIPRRWLGLAAAAVVLVIGGAVIGGYSIAHTASSATDFPQSAAMEDQFGIRFSRVAVVGDGGLITLSYVVLDSEKAFRFQSDSKHPPELVSETRSESTKRVSIMKQGHALRPGQTYYLVYQNTHAALQSGELATIVQGDVQLPHVPVL
jgi:hypothetical protein